MVPHSLNIASSAGGSQALWEHGERAFRRGWRLDDEGKRRVVLLVAPAADHPSRSNLDRLGIVLPKRMRLAEHELPAFARSA